MSRSVDTSDFESGRRSIFHAILDRSRRSSSPQQERNALPTASLTTRPPATAVKRSRVWMANEADPLSLAIFFGIYLSLCALGYFLRIEAFEVALMWPAAGVFIATLGITRVNRWWRVVVVAITAELIIELIIERVVNLPAALIFPFINAAEALAGATLALLLIPRPWHRRRSIEVVTAVIAVAVIVPGIGGLMATPALRLGGISLTAAVSEFGAWWAADFLGIILAAPIVGGMVLHVAVGQPLSTGRVLSAALALTISVATILLLLGVPELWRDLGLEYRLGITFCRLVLPRFAGSHSANNRSS